MIGWTKELLLGPTQNKLLAQQLSVASPSLRGQDFREMKTCSLDILLYKGDTPGWLSPEPQTSSAEQHVLPCILPDGTTEEDGISTFSR